MRHCKNSYKFNRTASHRRALFRNLSISLIQHGRIKTTVAKAKRLRAFVEPLITIAKQEALLNKNNKEVTENGNFKLQRVALRRKAFNYLRDKSSVKTLFEQIASRYESRSGGYTRILKCGYRFGDKAPVAFIELV